MTELVSVVIPTFNREALVAETLESVRAQTHESWEALVVDDGSDDGTFDAVRAFADRDERIRPLRREREPKGAPVCRNIGLENARGDFVVFLDSDDLLVPDCLQGRLERAAAEGDLDFLAFPMRLFDAEPGDRDDLAGPETGESHLDRFLRGDHPWVVTGPFWRIETLRRLGGFDERLLAQQDYDLNVRALLAGCRYRFFADRADACYRRGISDGAFRGAAAYTVAQFDSAEYLLCKLAAILRESDTWTPDRGRMLAVQGLRWARNRRRHYGEEGVRCTTRAVAFWHRLSTLCGLPLATRLRGLAAVTAGHLSLLPVTRPVFGALERMFVPTDASRECANP